MVKRSKVNEINKSITLFHLHLWTYNDTRSYRPILKRTSTKANPLPPTPGAISHTGLPQNSPSPLQWHSAIILKGLRQSQLPPHSPSN